MRKLTTLAIALALIATLSGSVSANVGETRYQVDPNFPTGAFSLANFRATLRGYYQNDIIPLRAHAKRVLDGMEYSSDASAQAEYSGTGVTITSDNANETEGSYSLKAVIDGTDNREFARTYNIDLSAYTSVTSWHRSSGTSDTIRFYVEDSGGDQSYWNMTTSGTADTWVQSTLDLSSPDGNNGTDATLNDVTSYGFQSLDLSTTYYFDTVKAIVGMTVAVHPSDVGDYYNQVYLSEQPLEVDAQSAPTITAPTTNPRIDILSIDSSGTLSWTTGTEASTPIAPWSSIGNDELPIALVYQRTTMTKVLDYEDKDTDTNQGYILADVRPFLALPRAFTKGSDVASATSTTLGNDGNFFDITGNTTITSITAKSAGTFVILQFDGALTLTDGSNLKLNGNFDTAAESVIMLVSDGTNWYEVGRNVSIATFVGLSDTPATLSGQGLKYLRVNSGGTAVELVSNPFNTTTGHDHDGTDSKKVLATNLDPTGVTSGQFLKSTGSAIVGALPALTTIGTLSFSNVSDTSNITGITTDNHYRIVISAYPASTGECNILLEFNGADSGSDSLVQTDSIESVPVTDSTYDANDFLLTEQPMAGTSGNGFFFADLTMTTFSSLGNVDSVTVGQGYYKDNSGDEQALRINGTSDTGAITSIRLSTEAACNISGYIGVYQYN